MFEFIYKSLLFMYNLYFNNKRDCRGVILGIENSGKTTLLYKLKLGEYIESNLNNEFNFETIWINSNLNLSLYDINGSILFRSKWQLYYQNVNIILYVVDASSSKDKLNESKEELFKIINNNKYLPNHIPILIIANKIDIFDNQLNNNQININNQLIEVLELNQIKNRPWYIQSISNKSNEGFDQLFNCISNII